jgi:hypothetical protein
MQSIDAPTCECDKKGWKPQLSYHFKYVFLYLLQVIKRNVDVFEVYVSNIIFEYFL